MNCGNKNFLSQIRALTACFRKRKIKKRRKGLTFFNVQYKDAS